MKKRILITILIAGIILGLYVKQAGAAWLSGWDQRIEITVSNDNIDSSLTHFPLLLYISADSGTGSTDISCVFDELTSNDNRKKIAVTKSDGTTEIYVEIEKWDDTNEQAWLWVSKSDLTFADDGTTTLYLYYDVDHADNDTYVGDTNDVVAESVWDSNFKGVWHLQDGASTSAVYDSTSNDHDDAKKGANEPIVTTSGLIANAQDCDGTDDYIFFPNDASYKELDGKDLTGLIWIKTTDGATWNESIFGTYSNTTAGGPTPNQAWHLFYGDGTVKSWIRRDDSAETKDATSTTTTLDDDEWHLVGFRKNGTTIEVLVDGVSEDSDALTSEGATDNNLVLGLGATYGRFLDFDVDEFTISSVSRSNSWIKATYYSNKDGLVSWGSEEEPPPEGVDVKIGIKSGKIQLKGGKLQIK